MQYFLRVVTSTVFSLTCQPDHSHSTGFPSTFLFIMFVPFVFNRLTVARNGGKWLWWTFQVIPTCSTTLLREDSFYVFVSLLFWSGAMFYRCVSSRVPLLSLFFFYCFLNSLSPVASLYYRKLPHFRSL